MSENEQQNPLAAVAVAGANIARTGPDTLSPLASVGAFAEAVKMAKYLATSELIPASFRGKPENVVIALELAHRINASAMAVMQSLYVVHGKPGFSAAFLVATLNATGRFSPLRYVLESEGDNRSCYCTARDRETGEVLTGPRMTIGIAKAEGWYGRTGSKWKTMPDLMLSYRAATLFVRLFAPEISLGLRTDDELADMGAIEGQATVVERQPTSPEDFGVRPRGGNAPPASTIVVDEQGRTIDKATGEVLDPPAEGDAEAQESAQDAPAAKAAETSGKSADAPRANAAEAGGAESKPAAGGAEPPEGNDEGRDPIGDLSPGMQRTLLRKCHEARVTWKDVWRGLGGLGISKATMNDALGWIDANSQA